jgi:hypothetical protein
MALGVPSRIRCADAWPTLCSRKFLQMGGKKEVVVVHDMFNMERVERYG